MSLIHSTGLKNYICDSGFGPAFDTDGVIEIRTGAQPTADGADSGTLLGTLALSSDAFAVASGGSCAANTVSNDVSVDASGTPGHFMFRKTGQTAATSSASATDRRLTGAIAGMNQLNGAINNAVTTITVDDTTHLAASGSVVIDTEVISYTGKTGTTLTGCTRNAAGSVGGAASHLDNAPVKQYPYDMHFDNIAWVAGGVAAISSFTYTPGP